MVVGRDDEFNFHAHEVRHYPGVDVRLTGASLSRIGMRDGYITDVIIPFEYVTVLPSAVVNEPVALIAAPTSIHECCALVM